MGKEGDDFEQEALRLSLKFKEDIRGKEVVIVSHFDTDGITSAAILIKALKRMDTSFSIKIIKGLDREFILNLPKDKVIVFLDLASSSFSSILEAGFFATYILDHHEIIEAVPSQINILNPELFSKQKISGAGVTYIFCKALDPVNIDSAKLAVLGMIGDTLERDVAKLSHGIVDESNIVKKRGLLIYPSTRPINRALEFSSSPFIPGVTGDVIGVLEILREAGIKPENGKYKGIIELNDDEMERLVTLIMLRNPTVNHNSLVGDIYLIKMFNKLEDAREISAKINACSRLGDSNLALLFCLEKSSVKNKVESVHVKYRQHIVSALKYVASPSNKFSGNGFILINARENIKDTIIGTISSILSSSSLHQEGTSIIGMAYSGKDEIKVSARAVGRIGRNLREVLTRVISELGSGDVGGHEYACGCTIKRHQEEEFISAVKRNFEIEIVQI